MILTHALAVSLLIIAPLVTAAPMKRNTGSYTVSGLGNRKKAITSAGGNDLDLAIAMMETENMQATYTYGDGKTGDSFNAVRHLQTELVHASFGNKPIQRAKLK
ncbi:hypothetical protein FRC09_008206 [Ceratobasidium sp. 395]|nr:hypothetical protein FRC09_008206 [Ceratobasidium sp. 395]